MIIFLKSLYKFLVNETIFSRKRLKRYSFYVKLFGIEKDTKRLLRVTQNRF